MSQTLQVISPVDDSLYLQRTYASAANIEKTLDNAKHAQAYWKATSIEERATVCRKAIAYFLEHANAIGEELTWQMGRPIRYASFEITKGFQERANYMIDIAEQSLADIPVEPISGFRRFIRREPLGTVLVLAPWNYPYLTSANAIIPALMAGNTVILKHARQTPLCAERYSAAFAEAGLPEGVFQHLHLDHKQVSLLLKDNRIDHVAFTGSVAGGVAVQEAIGGRFISTGLELGGKDPAYVRYDADLAHAVEQLVDGSYFNSGQSCCGIERIYVHARHFDDFLDAFITMTKQYVLGNPLEKATTLGPMVRTAAAEFAKEQIAAAILQGAEALVDPLLFPLHQPESPYLAPQVMINVNHSMRIMQEETFAPVVGIMPVRSDEEAIQLMNDSRYGLTASIWTTDDEAAIRIGNQLETGTCFMNRCDYLDPALAWTGVKDSGRGVALSTLGYAGVTRVKSFHLKA